MVRDESQANGQQPNADPDQVTPQGPFAPYSGAPQMPLGTGNLTQELAQLLAATIAHNQAQRGMGGGVPTGADLASLATLMQAVTQQQRTIAPTFKDGLSALSYGQPPQSHPHAPHPLPGHPHQGHQQAEIDPHHDDEPMPIPSTWRQPVAAESDRWFRQQMGAAVLGLAAGLMIVVPTVLWLSGIIGSGPKQKVAAATTTSTSTQTGDFAKASEIKTVKVQVRPVDRPSEPTYAASSVEPKVPVELTRQPEAAAITVATAKPEPPQARADELLTQATRRIESGDISGAREILSAADGPAVGPAAFALAETYDPNMLAAWGTRGAVADVAKARALYGKALTMGVNKAQVRLEGLR